jgi:fibronectin type 3 domain-containing protein
MQKQIPFWIAVVFAAHLSANGQSASKISAHLINAYTTGSSNIVAGHPRVLKVLDVGGGMVQAMRDYKANTPAGKIVLRVYSPHTYALDTDPDAAAAATNFWTTILQPSVNSLSASDRALIDYLEGPNEGQTPTLGYPGNTALQASQWFNRFWTNLTPLVVAAGYKPCIGSIAVGNPGGAPSEMQQYLAAFVPALRQAQSAGGAWSYHAYTIQYTTDVNVEFYYALRYRQFYSYFAQSFPDLTNMPLILTEGGVDDNGTPSTSGWQARGTQADYKRWLNWFDKQMAQDSYLLGCTLFQNGDPGGWSSFDLEPIASWLGTYLKAPAGLPPAPTGLSATLGSQSVALNWTSAPLNPTTYNIKRSRTNGGPYSIVATNVTEGVTASTYTDNAVTNGGTYYYVVSAVNALGEGANSSQVTATFPLVVPSAINCGGSAVSPFIADIYYSGGTPFSDPGVVNTNGLASPAPMAVYQTNRYGEMSYNLPFLSPNASYKVRLHFAETYSPFTSAGQRVFNVAINGAAVLNNFDVVAVAGGNYKAIIREFNAITKSDGSLAIDFTAVVNNPIFNAVETIANPSNSIPAAPTNLVAAIGRGKVTLSWSVPSGATSCNVKRATSSPGVYVNIATNIIAGGYLDLSFVPGTTYYYYVTAVNALGESAFSNQAVATPTQGLPDLVVTALSWTPTPAMHSSNLTFRATVKNQGSAATTNGIVIGVGFAVDGVGVTWSANTTTTLARGGTVVLTASGGPSGPSTWLATAGSHTLTAYMDDVNRFEESNEGNNISSTNLVVFVPPPRIASATVATNGNVTLNFDAFAGKNYRVQYKNNLSDTDWTSLGSDLPANSASVTVVDATVAGNPQRYYRVLQLD